MRSFLPNHPVINALSRCANKECGNKEAAEPPFTTTLKMCTACRSVSYCSVDCQKAHRKDHKHQCKQDAQSLANNSDYLAKYCVDNGDDDDDDDELFQSISPKEECPICILPIPVEDKKSAYYTCCWKLICNGCWKENNRITFERRLDPCCPFCRKPTPTENEMVVRLKKRMEENDSEAIFMTSQYYKFGEYGLPKDPKMEFELLLRAAELGNSNARCNVARFYKDGVTVPKDLVKAMEYRKEAAKRGNINARHHLGIDEVKKGKHRVAFRHWLISAAAGGTDSMANIVEAYRRGAVTKHEFSVAFASYKNVHKDEWSIEREAAAAATADETRRRNSSSN